MKKEEFIRIRVAGWQKKYISLQAEKAHKSLSQYVRDAAMDKNVTVIDGVDDLIRELRRQGNNLDQLVVMARQGHVELVNMEPFMEVYSGMRVLPEAAEATELLHHALMVAFKGEGNDIRFLRKCVFKARKAVANSKIGKRHLFE